jgi:DNA-binding NarL/FixJ family response regulator
MTLAELAAWHRDQAKAAAGAIRDFHVKAAKLLRAVIKADADRRRAIAEGMRKAEADGAKLGRPTVSAEKEAAVKKLLRKGTGTRSTAAEAGLSIGTVIRIKRELGLEVGTRPGRGDDAE